MDVNNYAFGRNKQCYWMLALLTAVASLVITTTVVRSSSRYAPIVTWQATTALPQAVANRNALVHGDYVYVVGGKSASDSPLGNVYAARIGEDGALGGWNLVATVPVPLYLHASAASETHLYIIGGWDGGETRREIWRAGFLSDGALSGFSKVADYPLAIDLHEAVIVGNRLYVIGGWTGSEPLDLVRWAELQPSGLGPWNTTIALPKKLYRLSATTHNNVIYVTGGFDNVAAQSNVYFSRVNSDGSLAGWQSATALPNATYYHETVIHDGRLLVIGGRGDGPEYADVYAASINANNTLGVWTPEPTLPESLHRFAAVSVSRNGSDFIYVIGGLHGAEYRASVYHSAYPSLPTPTPVPPTATPTPESGVTLQLVNEPQHWVAPGDTITYTVVYRVFGDQPVNSVLIESRIPASVELITESLELAGNDNYTYTGTMPGALIRWSLGDLPAGATGGVSYQVFRPLPKPPVIPRVLEIGMTGPDSAEQGAPITYQIAITNNTAFSLTDLLIVDTLPAGSIYVDGGDKPPVDGQVQWAVPVLHGDEVQVHEISVTAEQTIVHSNFYVSSDEGPTAKGADVIVTVINGLPPPASGDGVIISNTGVAASWQLSGVGKTVLANGVYNPAFAAYLPAIKR